MRREAWFYSDGLKISAVIYRPADPRLGERRPGIVCCHGYSGMKDAYLLPVPERLAELGYVAMAFDHRGFGQSEGPRARLIPLEQAADVGNALTFLEQQPEVDPGRLGLYGTSFGGANVVYVAAHDPRVKVTVATVAIGDGERWLKSLRPFYEWREFRRRLDEDRRRRVLTGESERVELSELMPGNPASQAVQRDRFKSHLTYTGGYPLENAEATLGYKPERDVHLIAPRPTLFITVENDGLVPPDESRSLHARAGEPKKLVVIPGADHYDVYQPVNPEVFELVMKESADWYAQHL